MRVVLCAVLAVALMTATAIADTAADGLRQGVAEAPATEAPPPPPTHFLPRPSQLMQAVGNYFHQHHQDTAAAHHASHSQHHVDAHGATPPAAPAAAAPAAAGATYPAPGTPAPPQAGPQPPHTQGFIASHLQQAGIGGGGDRPGLGGLIGNHHQGTHHPESPRPIIATRTVFVEVTKRVTRHPVCMTVYGERPPCLPYNEYKPSPYKKPVDDYRRSQQNHHSENSFRMAVDDDVDYNDMSEGYYINPAQVVKMGLATAGADSMFRRSARFITIGAPAAPSNGPAATFLEPAKSDDAAVATPALETAPLEVHEPQQRQEPAASGGPMSQLASTLGNMMPNLPMGPMGPSKHTPETRYEVKTLWVTKVERFTDYRVTATLVAENCVPTDSKIPFCNTGYAGPEYESGDYYPQPYTEKPHTITTPKPHKKPGYGSGHQPPNHRPHHTRPPPQTPTPAPYTPPTYTPGPYLPTQYPPQQYAPDPYAPAPYAPAPATPAPYKPAPAPYKPGPPPAASAYAPPAATPAQYPVPAEPYPSNYPPASQPPAKYPVPKYTPPPASSEPVHDYPQDGLDEEHWRDTDKSQLDEVAMQVEQESA